MPRKGKQNIEIGSKTERIWTTKNRSRLFQVFLLLSNSRKFSFLLSLPQHGNIGMFVSQRTGVMTSAG